MPKKTTRRTFMKQIAAAGALVPLSLESTMAAVSAASEETKLRHACIGVGGMGWADLRSLTSHPDVEIVAICDVDQRQLDRVLGDEALKKRFPEFKAFRDWRTMFAEVGDAIESVNVSTPDHMHAPAAMTALLAGKHVYCQKPLCHDIFECRAVAREAARRPKQVTQMGIQIQSWREYRMAVKMIQSGLVGKIEEVHSWSNKGWVGRAGETERRPDRTDPVPEYLDWELWLGCAPQRPYVEGLYHPGQWRRWIDFGTGTQGDMACHIVDPVFSALELEAPLSVCSECSPPFAETYSPKNKIVHVFPGNRYTAGKTLRFIWYDSGMLPDASLFALDEDGKIPGQGSLFVGEKGCVLLPHIGAPAPLPQARFAKELEAFQAQIELPHVDHYHSFVDACLGRGSTTAHFGYSDWLTETVLMGAIANRFPGEELLWDGAKLRFTNKPEANRFVRRTYRKGWEVDGLSRETHTRVRKPL